MLNQEILGKKIQEIFPTVEMRIFKVNVQQQRMKEMEHNTK